MDLKPKILGFLYDWASQNKIPHIKKNMLEDLEAFILSIIADMEMSRAADRMRKVSSEIKLKEMDDEVEKVNE